MNKKTLNQKATRAGIYYTIANMFLKGCVFLTLPLFTRILSTNDFGIYNNYMAYEGLLSAILGLGLYGTVKNAKFDFKENFNEYLSSVLSLSLIVFVFVVLILNLFYPFYGNYLGFSRFVTNCLVFQSFGSYLIYFYGSKLNIEFEYKSYIFLSFFNTIVNILLSFILIIYIFPNERYLGRILGSALPLILISIYIIVLIFINGKTRYEKKYWKYALTIGLPLIPHVVSQSLLSQFDRIMIGNMTSLSYSGIYSYMYTICTITYVICTSLDNAWNPWVYHKLNESKKKEILNSSKKYIFLFTFITICFICIMPEITKLMADKSYWGAIDLLIPLSLSNYFIFLYMIPVGIEYYYKKTKYISFGTFLAAIFNLILNYFAIKFFGYKSAAYTTLISYMLLFIFHWIIASKYDVNSIYSLKYIIKNIFVLFIVSIFIFLVNLIFNEKISIIIRYVIVVIFIVISLLKLKEFLEERKNEKNFKKSI